MITLLYKMCTKVITFPLSIMRVSWHPFNPPCHYALTYKLVPFWSWRDIIRYHDWRLLKDNLLNCILLLPAGALLPIITNYKIKWYQALVVGVLISAIIELSQLIFMRGLFEWDDMIHNGLGCMIGCLFVNIFEKEKNR